MATNSSATRLGHYTFLLFLLSACLGSFFFVKGFLRVKDYLPNRADTRFSPLVSAFGNSTEMAGYIDTHKFRPLLYKQVVWLIIDMMPIYMIKPNPETTLNYENIMEHVKTRLNSSVEKAAVHVFLSDEPTMTNSRVEAMGTGSHTSYVKIATGFQNAFAEEDNFIQQIHDNNRSSVHVGDSLWTQLFPKEHYLRTSSESAYSEMPLSELIRMHMNEEFQRDDWNFFVIHGNELDHNLHIYGWGDPKIVRNIHESDDDIEKAVSMMQPDSLIMAFGDHGATRASRHGGGTKEEIESGMFVYSGKNLTFRTFKYPASLAPRVRDLISRLGTHVNHTFLNREAFPQLDGVATMAAILNIPIPFSNLGVVIPEVLHYDNCNVAGCLYELFMEHVVNFAQVLKYVKAFVARDGNLRAQEGKMQGFLDEIKTKVLSIMRNSAEVLKAEADYVEKGSEDILGQAMQTRYIKLVDDMFEVMIKIREELGHNSKVFKDQWTSMNWLLMYSNLVIRVIVSIMISCTLILIYLSIQNDNADLLSSLLTSAYPALASLVLFIAVLLNPFLTTPALIATYTVAALGLGILFTILMKNRRELRELIRNEPYIMPVFLGAFIVIIQSVGFSAFAMSQHYVLPYIVCTALVCFVFIMARKRPERWYVFVAAIGLAGLIRFATRFGELKLDTEYWVCSAIPSAIFCVGALYYTFRSVHSGVNRTTRLALSLVFLLCFGGMMLYQIGEVTGTYKDTYFTYILVPRTIFLLTVLQMGFLVASLHFRKLLWTEEPSKPRRIYAFFTFMAMAILPALLMMVGPYQQIYFLMIYFIARLLNYCMERIGLENSFFQYTLYSVIMQSMFFSTGHVLDFMSLRIQRAFVGFPNFSTGTNFTLAFFETVGVFSFMLVILPTLSTKDPSEYIESETPSPLNSEAKSTPVRPREEDKTELALVKNYLTVLLHFEMVHSGLTRFLIDNFSGMFFMVSPVEFTFRFIDWYIYILAILYAYILGGI